MASSACNFQFPSSFFFVCLSLFLCGSLCFHRQVRWRAIVCKFCSSAPLTRVGTWNEAVVNNRSHNTYAYYVVAYLMLIRSVCVFVCVCVWLCLCFVCVCVCVCVFIVVRCVLLQSAIHCVKAQAGSGSTSTSLILADRAGHHPTLFTLF